MFQTVQIRASETAKTFLTAWTRAGHIVLLIMHVGLFAYPILLFWSSCYAYVSQLLVGLAGVLAWNLALFVASRYFLSRLVIDAGLQQVRIQHVRFGFSRRISIADVARVRIQTGPNRMTVEFLAEGGPRRLGRWGAWSLLMSNPEIQRIQTALTGTVREMRGGGAVIVEESQSGVRWKRPLRFCLAAAVVLYVVALIGIPVRMVQWAYAKNPYLFVQPEQWAPIPPQTSGFPFKVQGYEGSFSSELRPFKKGGKAFYLGRSESKKVIPSPVDAIEAPLFGLRPYAPIRSAYDLSCEIENARIGVVWLFMKGFGSAPEFPLIPFLGRASPVMGFETSRTMGFVRKKRDGSGVLFYASVFLKEDLNKGIDIWFYHFDEAEALSELALVAHTLRLASAEKRSDSKLQ